VSTANERRAVEHSSARGDSPRDGVLSRTGLLLVLCGMTLLLVGPILPWFHTELITARPDLSAIPPISFLEYLIRLLPANVTAFVGIALTYIVLALGASLSGIWTLAAAVQRQDPRGDDAADARVGIFASVFSASIMGLSSFGLNGMVTLAWPSSRVVLDGGYFVTSAGFIATLIGNGLIALVRRKGTRERTRR